MSLITRCPTCETMFRVVPDQLRVSEGWVRCGQCAEIFDASQNMVAPAGSAADPAQPARTVPEPPVPPVAPAVPPPQARPQDAPVAGPPAQAASTPPNHAAVAPAKPQASDRIVLTEPGTSEPIWADAPLTDPQTALMDAPEPAAHAVSGHATARTDEPRAAAAMKPREVRDEQVSFLQHKHKSSFWQNRTTRIVLWLLLLALLVGLAVQVFVSQRDRIAALAPSTRPMLLALCAWQGCAVSPLRQIESVVIDSSSFSRIRGDDYRLGFSLKNKASIQIAMPAIELALTDPQDQPVIRRVIHPAEFGAASDAIAGASAWNGTIALNVKPGANGERIAGYRLLAFYP